MCNWVVPVWLSSCTNAILLSKDFVHGEFAEMVLRIIWYFFSYFFLSFVSASITHLDIIVLISERVSSSFVNSVLSHTLSFRNVTLCSFTLSLSLARSRSLSLFRLIRRAPCPRVYCLCGTSFDYKKNTSKIKKEEEEIKSNPFAQHLIVDKQVCELLNNESSVPFSSRICWRKKREIHAHGIRNERAREHTLIVGHFLANVIARCSSESPKNVR